MDTDRILILHLELFDAHAHITHVESTCIKWSWTLLCVLPLVYKHLCPNHFHFLISLPIFTQSYESFSNLSQVRSQLWNSIPLTFETLKDQTNLNWAHEAAHNDKTMQQSHLIFILFCCWQGAIFISLSLSPYNEEVSR